MYTGSPDKENKTPATGRQLNHQAACPVVQAFMGAYCSRRLGASARPVSAGVAGVSLRRAGWRATILVRIEQPNEVVVDVRAHGQPGHRD
jgi:hypothetical protein